MFVPNIIYNKNLESDYLDQKKFISDQIDYSCYLGLPSMIIQCPSTTKSIASLASIVNSKLCLAGGLESLIKIWFYFNLMKKTDSFTTDDKKDKINSDQWRQWNQLRDHLVTSRKIGVAIELESNDHLPGEEECARWAGEPISVLILNTAVFLKNFYQSFLDLLYHLTII